MNHKSERALSVKPPRDSAATVHALALVERGWTAYRAAKHVGIALSTIYRAVARQRARERVEEMYREREAKSGP